MEQDADSDREEDLLQTWLGELDTLKKGLTSNGGGPGVQLRSDVGAGDSSRRRSEYRRSLINLEQSQDEELDAILGELSQLENQFSREITDKPTRDLSDCVPSSRPAVNAGARNCSPDTDSAFCDNVSVLSSSSATSSTDKKSSGVSSAGSSTDEEARIKAEKIKIAIEKIKEASVKKLFIKVFTSDGSAKSLLVDEKMSVGQVTRMLAEKNHVTLDPKWALVELVPDLYMERVYEDHEQLVENCLLWKVDSKNTLWFIERPEKFDLFLRPEIYLLGSTSSENNESMEDHCRQELVEEYFSVSGVGAPQVEGFVWLKTESKKSWKKFYFVLRTSGLYYSAKGRKNSKDLLCLCTFDVNQVYYGVGWKRKFKAPTDFCFGIKHPQIQAKNPKYIRYMCVDSQKELHQWVTGIRIAKNGKHLHDNYRTLVEEITHADLDILVGKRGSVNSAVCLSSSAKAESCATNLNLHSPVLTPLSENKSFDSVLSSGIRSDHFKEELPSSTCDLVRFDLRINDTSTPVPGASILKRTSKSSSSLSDKSSGIEQGFESDHPAGGTIKKRPPTNLCQAEVEDGHQGYSNNIRLGAGGTLLRRSNSAERLTSGRNYEELQQLLDELHTNVKQAKDIQAKIKNSIKSSEEMSPASVDFPPPPGIESPPPPPPRTSSRLSIDEEFLPPPPPELQTTTLTSFESSTLGRRKLPPIAPKPNLHRVPSSPKFKPSYGTLPNPGKKSSKHCDHRLHRTSTGRRISFDDNIQLIDDDINGAGSQKSALSAGFMTGLEQVVSNRIQHSQSLRGHSLSPSPLRGTQSSPSPLRGTPHSPSPLRGTPPSPSPLRGTPPSPSPLRMSCQADQHEPLYTMVVKPGRPRAPSLSLDTPGNSRLTSSPGNSRLTSSPGNSRLTSSPGRSSGGPRALGSSPNQSQVCCVGSFRCEVSGDSSPEQSRYTNTYRNWREGESGDYWSIDTCDPQPRDDVKHASVPSSPSGGGGSKKWGSTPSPSATSKLWGSLRGKKGLDKRNFSPHNSKTAS